MELNHCSLIVLHVPHHLVIFAIDICSRNLTIVPMLISLGQNFPKSEDSHIAHIAQWILSWYSTRVTCEFGLSDSHRLTSRGAQKFLVDLHAAARATCHVPPIGPRQAPPSFRRFGASIGATPVPIGPAVRAPCPEMLEHTDTQTH